MSPPSKVMIPALSARPEPPPSPRRWWRARGSSTGPGACRGPAGGARPVVDLALRLGDRVLEVVGGGGERPDQPLVGTEVHRVERLVDAVQLVDGRVQERHPTGGLVGVLEALVEADRGLRPHGTDVGRRSGEAPDARDLIVGARNEAQDAEREARLRPVVRGLEVSRGVERQRRDPVVGSGLEGEPVERVTAVRQVTAELVEVPAEEQQEPERDEAGAPEDRAGPPAPIPVRGQLRRRRRMPTAVAVAAPPSSSRPPKSPPVLARVPPPDVDWVASD